MALAHTKRSSRGSCVYRVTQQGIVQTKHKSKWVDMNVIPRELEDIIQLHIAAQDYDKVFSATWGN